MYSDDKSQSEKHWIRSWIWEQTPDRQVTK